MPSAARRRTRSAASAPASAEQEIAEQHALCRRGRAQRQADRNQPRADVGAEHERQPERGGQHRRRRSARSRAAPSRRSSGTARSGAPRRSGPQDRVVGRGAGARGRGPRCREAAGEAATTMPSDRIISARPMTMRPTCCTVALSTAMKAITPAMSSTGTRPERSKARACTTSVEPTSAPSITASAAESAMSPRSANDTTMSPVADELCTRARDADAGEEGAERVRGRLRDGAAEAFAEGAQHAGPHHPRRPEQERDASEEVQENGVAGHCRGMPRGVASEGVDPKGTVHPRTGSHNEKRLRFLRLFVGFLPLYHPLVRRVVAEAPDPASARP